MKKPCAAACALVALTAIAQFASAADTPRSSRAAAERLATLLAHYGTSNPASDLNADTRVDSADLLIALADLQAGNASGPLSPTLRRVDTMEPAIVGIGTKIRIRGAGMGTKNTAAVVFGDDVIADTIETHAPDEIIVTVPKGAPSGDAKVKVVVGAGDAALLKAMSRTARIDALARGAQTQAPGQLLVVNSFTSTPRNEPDFRVESIHVVPHRLIVGLRDFEGFPTAAIIAKNVDAQLAGFIAPGNSYILDTRSTPTTYQGLVEIMRRVKADPRVVDVCPDMIFDHKAPEFATADFLTRYGLSYNANVNGREDSWNMDRIQAPAAWNLIQRFGPTAVGVPKIAVLDTGVDIRAGGRHAEFTNVNVTQVAPATASRVNLAGTTVTLPTGLTDVAYTRGDSSGHGTAVCSIIAARNKVTIPGTGGPGQPPADPGVNGICVPFRAIDSIAHLQVHRGSSGNYPNEPGEPGDGHTLTDFLAVINYAAITDCKLMNASWGQPRPINPVGPTPPFGSEADIVRVGLRKLAKQLNQ